MIKNIAQLIRSGTTPLGRTVRKDLCSVIESVLNAVDPYALVTKTMRRSRNRLFMQDRYFELSTFRRIFVVGAGKAVYQMAQAVEDQLGERVSGGCINIPSLPKKNKLRTITTCLARHPTPDIHGVAGARQIQNILLQAGKEDLVVAVISGGGSALMPLPAEGITLKEKIELTSLLLKTPATIHEINVVRKHLSQIKGGQFACMAYPATLVGLYISDIIDDSFDTQASGPTAPDPSTFQDAMDILKKYEIWNKTPKSIQKRFVGGTEGYITETPKSGHPAFCDGRVFNYTIGNHQTAVRQAVRIGKKFGYHTLELTSSLQGEAREVAKTLVAIGKHIKKYNTPMKKPALIVAGGETTVHVRGKGKGGRNQELVLAALQCFGTGMAVVSFGTDGVDGMTPIPVAGAIADWGTLERAIQKKMDPSRFLFENDSYHFFKAVGGHIHTGYTGTNVGDLMLLVVQ